MEVTPFLPDLNHNPFKRPTIKQQWKNKRPRSTSVSMPDNHSVYIVPWIYFTRTIGDWLLQFNGDFDTEYRILLEIAFDQTYQDLVRVSDRLLAAWAGLMRAVYESNTEAYRQ